MNNILEKFKNVNKNKVLALIITAICVIFLGFIGINLTDNDVDKLQNTVEQVVENTENKQEENQSTTEILNVTEEDEQTVEVQETNIENEGFQEQGSVAYEGANGTPNVAVGDYKGLTYYSQIDRRWSNNLYTSVGDSSQTIGTSGCGPTSAAMVVSSIKGTITPDRMSDLYVQNGYRSSNQGTYWSAFKWTADVFDIGYTESYRLDDAINLLNNNYYVIASCNQGLFTYGGHFIVLTGIENGHIKVYDPYLYSGKFDVSSRRGKASVQGNTVYVSVENFRNYANYQKFFAFENDRTDVTENDQDIVIVDNNNSNVSQTNYNVTVTANSGLNIRSGASTNYQVIGGYAKNTVVNITNEANGWGKTKNGWINLMYTSKSSSSNNVNSNSTGTYKVNASVLNVRTGPGINYKTKSYSQLTANAREQNRKLGNYYTNGYKNGVVCTVTKVQNGWGLTVSGWISLNYCRKI